METIKIIEKYYTQIKAEIQEIKENNDPQFVFKKDVRGQLFAIEGILRMHLKYPKTKLSKSEIKELEQILLETKAIEDALGAYSLVYELAEFATKENVSDLKSKISEDKIPAFAVLLKALNRYKKQLPEHSKIIASISWPKKEKKFIKKAMKSEIKRINKKIKQDLVDLVMAEEYGYHELEEGLHEFRRAIRWISIYIQGYKSFFSFAPLKDRLTKEETKLVSEYKNNPFTQLNKDQSLILVDPIKYYKLSEYINTVGKIKTRGEMIHFLIERYGYTPKSKLRIEKEAQKKFQQFVKDDVLTDLIVS